jgi:hypothetical protein
MAEGLAQITLVDAVGIIISIIPMRPLSIASEQSVATQLFKESLR